MGRPGVCVPWGRKGSTGPIFTPKPEPLGGSTGPDSTGAADLIQNLSSSPPTPSPFANSLHLHLKLPFSLLLAEQLNLTLSYEPFLFPHGEHARDFSFLNSDCTHS